MPQTEATTMVARLCIGDYFGHRAGRIGVGAHPDDHVDQDDGGVRLGQALPQGVIARRRLDHRVRAAAGIFVGSEVDQPVCRSVLVEGQGAGHRNVGAHEFAGPAQHPLGLGAKGAAAEQTQDPAPAGGEGNGGLAGCPAQPLGERDGGAEGALGGRRQVGAQQAFAGTSASSRPTKQTI